MDAGQITVKLGAQVDPKGFDDYDKALQNATRSTDKAAASAQASGSAMGDGFVQGAAKVKAAAQDTARAASSAGSQAGSAISGGVSEGVTGAEASLGRLKTAFKKVQLGSKAGKTFGKLGGVTSEISGQVTAVSGIGGKLAGVSSGFDLIAVAAGGAALALKTFADSQTNVAQESKDVTDALLAQQVAQQGTADANLDVADANLTVTEATNAYGDALSERNKAERELDRVLKGQPATSKAAKDAMEQYKGTQRGVADASQAVSDAQAGVADAQSRVTDATTRQTQAHRALKLASDDLHTATIKQTTAEGAAADATKKYGATSSEATAATNHALAAAKATVSAKARVESATRSATAADKGVTTAQNGVAQAARRVKDAEDAQKRSVDTMRKARSDYQRVLRGSSQESQVAKDAAAKLNDANTRLERSDITLSRAKQQAAAAGVKQGDAQKAEQAAAASFAQQLGGLTSKINEQGQAQLTANGRGAMAAKAAQDGATKAKAYAAAIQDAASKTDGLSAESKLAVDQVAGVVTTLGHVPDKTEANVITQAVATGRKIEVVNGLLQLVPEDTPANVSTDAPHAAGAIDGVTSAAHNVPGSTPANITTNADAAAASLRGVANAIAGIFGKTVTITEKHVKAATGYATRGPQMALIGEDGPEVVVPVGAKHRDSGLKWLSYAASALGVTPMAKGGTAGKRGQYWWEDDKTVDGKTVTNKARVAHEKAMDRLDAEQALAKLTKTPRDDLRAARHRVAKYRSDLSFARAHGAPPRVVADLATGLDSANGDLADLLNGSSQRRDDAFTKRETQLQTAVSLAALTKGTRDDKAAARNLLAFYTRNLAKARRTHAGAATIGSLAQNVASARSALASLTGSSVSDSASGVRDANVSNLQKRLAESQARAGLAESFSASILGSGDLGLGPNAAPNITINTLHPGDSRTLRAVNAAAAQGAYLTPTVRTNRVRA